MPRRDIHRPEGGTFDARSARQGETILRHRWSIAIFLGALAGLVILVIARAVLPLV